jgi:glutamate racemase
LALIGVFDSGVGGLSILDESLRQLPQHDYIYLADSANAPYGEKSSDWITARSLVLCKYLADQGCDAIVVACNTATAKAIEQIRASLSIPIVGVEPGIKPASMQSQNGIVGVLATEATLNSDKFNALLATLPSSCTFIKQSGAGLVPLIEAGKANSEETLSVRPATPSMTALVSGYSDGATAQVTQTRDLYSEFATADASLSTLPISLRISAATTPKPLPCSPARAASIAALSASRLV